MTRKNVVLCKNCGHELVSIGGKWHHGYEFVSWFEAPTKRHFRCDYFKADGKTPCNCENPIPKTPEPDTDVLGEKIIREMLVKQGD